MDLFHANNFSKFYYGHEINETNFYLDVDEGSGEFAVELDNGAYSLQEFVTEIERALNDAGSLTYIVTVDRITRLITISASGVFSLKAGSGVHVGTSAWQLMGFNYVNKTGAMTYVGDFASGYEYKPQYLLQDYIPSSNFQQYADSTVSKSASGDTETVSFGLEKFIQLNIRYITNIPQPPNSVILNNSTGVEDCLAFLRYVTRKNKFEFMVDENRPDVYETVLLEKLPEYSTGTGFKLKELYDKGAFGYYETGTTVFRVALRE